jgi:reactive chlorine resistance protein C
LPVIGRRISTIGGIVVRYGLVVVIGWIGGEKYTGSEATRIQLYIAHSPFMSWMNHILSVRALSGTLGTVEITGAVLIALRPWLPRVSAIGSVVGILLFLSTLSFLFSTPGVTDPAAGGFPALSPVGQFLLKDLVLIGASIWTLGESLMGSPVSEAVFGEQHPDAARIRRSIAAAKRAATGSEISELPT